MTSGISSPRPPELSREEARARLIALDRFESNQSLANYVPLAWAELEPTQKYVPGWHTDAICEHLEAVTCKWVNRLLINVPPGSSKSLLSSVFWPSWEWGPKDMRSMRYLATAFNDGPVKRDTRKMRDLVASPWYQDRWPRVKLVRSGETSFSNSYTGSREGVPFGSLTSQRGDRLIIDDPHSTKTAESTADRTTTVRLFKEGAINRLNDQEASAIIVIMQRLHEGDISGEILANDMGYTHLCYPDDTEVLARGGWKLFADLLPGEEVMGVSPDTLEGRWEVPTNYVRYPYSGQLKRWKSDVFDLSVTPDHRMVYKDYNDWGKERRLNWRVAPAEKLPKHFFVPQAVVWQGSNDLVEFAGKLWKPDVFSQFMGWYLSEGYANAEKCSTVIVQQAGRAYCDEITDMLAASPFPTLPIPRGGANMLGWHIGDKGLAVALAALGTSHYKRAPEQVKALAPKYLEEFLLAYAKGDGHFTKKNGSVTISSRSKRMVDDLQECAAKCGWASSVDSKFEIGGQEFNGYAMPGGTQWKIYIRSSKVPGETRKWYAKIRADNCFDEQYTGDVFCVSVPSTALLVRKNGRVAVSGNCLPMEYDPKPFIMSGKVLFDPKARNKVGFRDPRTEEGQLLDPVRFPAPVVAQLAKDMGAYAYAGQYGQRPVPREGGMFKRAWFDGKMISADQVPYGTVWVRHWDLAATKKETAAFTAGVRMGRTPDGRYIVSNSRRKQEEGLVVRKMIKDTAVEDGYATMISLPQDPGQAGKVQKSDMVAMLAGFTVAVTPEMGDKASRAEPFATQCEAGNVYLVAGGEWIGPYLDELCLFPGSKFKDQVDASVGAFGRLVQAPAQGISGSYGR